MYLHLVLLNLKAVEEELIKTSPEFDPYLFEHRDEILRKQNEEWNRKIAIGQARLNGMSAKEALDTDGQGYKNKPTVTCPYCRSANCTKISFGHRWLSTGLFGLASSDVGKQWKCKNGECAEYKHVIKVCYTLPVPNATETVVEGDELFTHRYKTSYDLYLYSEKEAFVVSKKAISIIQVTKED